MNKFCYYDAQGMLNCSTVEKFTQAQSQYQPGWFDKQSALQEREQYGAPYPVTEWQKGESHANPTAVVQPFCTGDQTICTDKAYSWISQHTYQEAPSLWIEQFKSDGKGTGKSSGSMY